MSVTVCRTILASSLVGLGVIVHTETRAPAIWDDRALAEWATPIAALKMRPTHYTTAEYYSVPADNLRTYPVYPPDREPPGYWEALQKKKPEPLVDASTIRGRRDWIAAGARAFRELDDPLTRTDDPALIARARDPKTFVNVAGLADGTIFQPRWVVTDRGVMLSNLQCATCHRTVNADRTIDYAGPLTPNPVGVGAIGADSAFRLGALAAQRSFGGDGPGAIFRRMFDVPWDPAPDPRLQRFFTVTRQQAGGIFANGHGVIPRKQRQSVARHASAGPAPAPL
jgi:hypothetical protein